MSKKTKILIYAVVLVLLGSNAFSQDWVFDAQGSIKNGNPLLVTVYVSPLSGISGTLSIGQRSLTSQYLYDEQDRLVEWVYFEDGKPVEYDQCTYDGSRLTTKITKTEHVQVTSTFSREKDMWVEIDRKDDSSVVSWSQRTELQTQGARTIHWTLSFDGTNLLTGASRTTKDSLGRAIETVYYGRDRKMAKLRSLEYQDNLTVEKTYDQDRELTSVSTLTADVNGQITERVLESPREGRSFTHTEFTYDGDGNWIESTAFRKREEAEAFDPLFRVHRDITFRSGTKCSHPSLEPDVLYPRKNRVTPEAVTQASPGTVSADGSTRGTFPSLFTMHAPETRTFDRANGPY
jgi:hypothetical protein